MEWTRQVILVVVFKHTQDFESVYHLDIVATLHHRHFIILKWHLARERIIINLRLSTTQIIAWVQTKVSITYLYHLRKLICLNTVHTLCIVATDLQ